MNCQDIIEAHKMIPVRSMLNTF